MAKVVIVAQVEDLVKWEAGFRTHGDLFRSQTVKDPISFGTLGTNEVAVCFEPEDVAVYMAGLHSPATAEAMAFDGIRRESVRIFVLDQKFEL